MGQQGPLPFLRYCGVEVANAARTLSYLRAGLGNTATGHWELGPGDVCSVLYREDGSGCVPGVFTSPAADPAPWYDPLEPGSATFLGPVLLDIQGYDSTIDRSIADRLNGLGGGVFGAQHRKPRTWKFRAALISSDDAGAEYGLRWLTQVLQASECATCATCDVTVRLACPPDNCSNDDLGKWVSYDVGLTEGPKEVEPWGPARLAATSDVLGACRDYVIVEWTMAAANPYLYKPRATCRDVILSQQLTCTDICAFLFGSPGSAVCCHVTPPQRGVLGSVITLSATGGSSSIGFGGLLLEAYDVCPDTSSSGTPTPTASIQLSSVVAGSSVTVDSARHRITVTDAAGNVTDGTNLVVLAAGKGIQWLEARDCDQTACFCVRPAEPCSSGTVEVLIQTQEREG